MIEPKKWPPRLEIDMASNETYGEYYRRYEKLHCLGYAISLPQVIEVARLYRWWDKGSLESAMRGKPVTESLRDGIDIFGAEIGAVDMARMDSD